MVCAIRLYTTAPIVESAVIKTMFRAPSMPVYPRIRDAENQEVTLVPAWFLADVRLFTVCCSDSKTPRLCRTQYNAATATNSTMKATTETTKLNFMTDHGSTRERVSCAWRRESFRLPLAPLTLTAGRLRVAVAVADGRLPA